MPEPAVPEPAVPEPTMLADHTTLRLGGPAGRFTLATSERTLVEAVRRVDEAGESLLLIAGGSNLVIADQGFAGHVVKVATRGIGVEYAESEVLVAAAAGESWDDFVLHAVESGWTGVEALSGIPGSVGATPIQNVGAYGQEVAQRIEHVRVWDRRAGREQTLTAEECGFGYRNSRFKADPTAYLVLAVTFRLPVGRRSAPIEYAELARVLGVEVGETAPLGEVRRAVLALRAGKGMVLDAADHDTWSAGSFFTNPVLEPGLAAALPADAPRFPQADGRVKTSAAWLIEHAGFAKGHGNDRVALSGKHTLALTNRGEATTADLLRLALEVRDGVELAFGVRLVNEPVLVGCRL